ncbi:MAG: ATP-binding protein [Ruminococcus sp.]|nr:ATP-binding protein [Ruminococcus sp.]
MAQARQMHPNMGNSFDRVSIYNNSKGTLTGYDCPKCHNKGNYMAVLNDEEILRPCECMEKRKMLKAIHESGLEEILSQCTFDSFEATEDWQKNIKYKAVKYAEDNEGKWFYIGGQVGSGKTHICTAIVGKLIKAGHNAKYMMWRDEIVRLKAMRNSEDFDDMIAEYKKIKVLYIDDLFKTVQGKQPTQADIDIAFEIINYRYIHKDLITIFSCEKYIDEITEIDEAVGSRINQKARGFNLAVAFDKSRNYRLKEQT